MERRKCANPACRRLFEPNPRNGNQTYCSRKQCQMARKAKWQREKRAGDEDYRKNQADSQARWTARNEGYWKRYRASNPEYENRNREKQKEQESLEFSSPPQLRIDFQRNRQSHSASRIELKSSTWKEKNESPCW